GGALRAVGIRRSVIRSPTGWVSLGAAVAVALILSFGASAQWQSLALFMHSTPTGTTDPVLGQDISFYLLTLPFLHVVGNWARWSRTPGCAGSGCRPQLPPSGSRSRSLARPTRGSSNPSP